MAKEKLIRLNDLLINTENYRFETVGSQKEAIDKMIEDQNDKLYNLAEHIVQNGLNPNDKIQVVVSNHDSKKFLVLEGNRRTVSLKLLLNPELIDNNNFASLKKRFKKLNEDNKAQIPNQLASTIYDDPTEANKWIKLKHFGQNNGVGTVDWTGQQVQRYEEKVEGKSSTALQIIQILKNSDIVKSEIKQNLSKLPITNLDRLLADPAVRSFLGIEINNGVIQSSIDKKEIEKGLAQVAKDLLDPKFNVKKIYTKDDRKDYIAKFPKAQVPNSAKKAAKPWQYTSSPSPSLGPTPPKHKPNPKNRTVLIPKSCALKIDFPKVNAIYHELLKLDVEKYTNAVSVLFRVFVELSIDSYIEANNLTSSPSSAKSGVDFQQKVFQVTNHLESKKLADQAICKGIKVAIRNSNDLLGIDTWHAYVHNNRFSPTPNNLTITWDGMQDFMIILWNNIN